MVIGLFQETCIKMVLESFEKKNAKPIYAPIEKGHNLSLELS